jgi:PTS system sucrose-specific IIC component
MMSKEKEVAEQIIAAVGGRENIAGAAYCMTRLRLTVHAQEKVDRARIKTIPKVLGMVEQAGQFQVVLGPGVVNKVAGAFSEITGLQMGEVVDAKAVREDRNRTPVKMFLRKLSSVFVPLIPAIVASGMVAGLTNIAVRTGADPHGNFVAILNVIGWGLFSYLGIFVGINAAKEFGGTPAMGGLAGVLLINPAIATIKINGMALVPGRGGLIGVLLVAWFMCALEKRLRKIIPNAVDIIVTPALTLFIAGFAAYYLLQPIGGYLSDGIVAFFKGMLSLGGGFAGFILAGTFLPIVMTGLHQGLVPVHMEFLNTLKENPLLPILAMAGCGQVGAAFAVYFKTRNRKLKEVVKGALPVGILGIGEPLIFGVTLPLGRPFITACIGSGFGGAFQAIMRVKAIAMGVSGLPLAFLIKPGGVGDYLCGVLIAYVAGFVITWFVGFDDPPGEDWQSGRV